MSQELWPRFDMVTRTVHWVTAADAFIVLLTATILYVPEMSAQVGRRATVVEVHVFAGLFLAVPTIAALALGSGGDGLRRDITELSMWNAADRRWLRRKRRATPMGKYNGGQKLVTGLFAGLFTMQLLTGSLMHWHDPFTDSWRTGATFVHDWAYLALGVLVLGHIWKAWQEPVLLTSMRTGSVPADWARVERPSWDPIARRDGCAAPRASDDDSRRSDMWIRRVGGVVLVVIGAVWILQGLDIVSGSGMSGRAVWAVFGALLMLVGSLLIFKRRVMTTSVEESSRRFGPR